MFNRSWFLAAVCLIAATTVGNVIATNEEEPEVAADEEIEIADESDIVYPNETDSEVRAINIPDSLPIQESRVSMSEPCGVPDYPCPCPDSTYRTIDGTCNNLLFPGRGSAGSPFSRLQKGRYANDDGKVITHTAAGRLPLARVLSYTLFKDKDVPERKVANAIVPWAQVVAHDGSFINERTDVDGNFPQCCTKDGQMLRHPDPNCISIKLPRDDPFYSKFHIDCMAMVRSVILDTTGCPTHDINQISTSSHYLDMSFLYGNSKEDVDRLRSFSRGLLKVKYLHGHYGGKRRMFLPQQEDPLSVCFTKSAKDPCFLSGDFRVNQNLGIAGLQTVLLREHNRLAKIFHRMHRDWDDETLFQEARRVNIAQFQYITYNSFLPIIIGKQLMENLHLFSPTSGFDSFYLPEFDVSTMNEFSAAGYRNLHTLIQGHYDLANKERCPFEKLFLRDFYNKPGVIEKKDNLEALFRGLTTQPSQSHDRFFTVDDTHYLLRDKLPFGDDLEAIDVQRGRDHGLPTYNDMRYYCGLPRAKHFDDLLDVIPRRSVHRLRELYRSVHQIDFFVGATLEYTGVFGDHHALTGTTFGCVIGEQFWRWKFGDRYYFDLENQAGSFTLEQINGIKKTSFAALLCENLDIEFIQENPFLQLNEKNKLKHCKDIVKMDLSGFENYTPNPICGPNTS